MKFSVYAYLWDLIDRPQQEVLTQLKSLGCDGVTLAASYHAGKFLHPRNRNTRVYFPEDGTIYFRPRERYGEIQPKMSSIVGETDAYEEIASRAEVHAWTVLLHNSRLGAKYPHLTVKNAYGDGYVYSLCPSQQAVREYAVTLCHDLATHYPIKSLVIETPGFLPYTHGYHHEFCQFPLNFVVEVLLGFCFCEACCKAAADADLDLLALKARVKEKLEFQFKYVPQIATSAPSWLNYDLLFGLDDLNAFICWRSQQVSRLVAAIKQGLPDEVSLGCIPSVQQPLSLAWIEGTDYAALAKRVDYLELPLYNDSLAETRANLLMINERLSDEDIPLHCILRPGLPDMQGDRLEETLLALEKLCIPQIAFYNYGLLTETNLKDLSMVLNRRR